LAIKRKSIITTLGLDQADPQQESIDRLSRDLSNLGMRLQSQGVDTTTPKPEDSLLSKALKVLNIPGAGIRGVIRAGVDDQFDLSDISLWDNQTQGIEILDAMGLAPKESDNFGTKAARFGLGLATDIVTDPLSYLTGGLLKPLQVTATPIIGKSVATLTKQGAAQPFLRGVSAGLKNTGALGATLGDEGVLAARRAATAASRGGIPKLASNVLGDAAAKRGAVDDALRQNRTAVESSLANRAPRALTGSEAFGLQAGASLRESPMARGLIQAFSNTAMVDPAYASLRRGLADRVSGAQRKNLGQLDDLVKSLTPEDQRLVTNLVESSGERAKYAYVDPQTGVYKRLERIQPIARAIPSAGKLLDDAPLEVLPDHIYNSFRFVTDTLQTYGNERLKRGLLGSIISNYFPHKLKPDPMIPVGTGASRLSSKQQSAMYREIREPLQNIAGKPGMPDFEQEFVRPFAKEMVESIRSVETYDFFGELNKQFGINADDMVKRFGFTPGGKIPDTIENYKLVDYAQFLVKGKESQAYGKLGKFYLPADIADDITRLHSSYNSDEGINTFMKLWDGATNFWRPLVTTMNFGFHINNFVGNMWNSFLGGMSNPKRLMDGYDVFLNRAGDIKAGVNKISFSKLHELATDAGVVKSGFFDVETGRDGFRLVRDGLPKPVNEGAIRKAYQTVNGYGKTIGEFVEGINRSALFTDQIVNRLAEYTGEVTDDVLKEFARESADHVNKYLFDYAHGLTQFERQYMRRLAPFYSWTRFNIPLQVAELINQPGKFLLFDKVRDNLAMVNPSPGDTPPWLREALPTGIQTGEGAQVYWNPRLPMQDISRIPFIGPGDTGREVFGMANPLIKLPIELATNYNFFTGRPIERYEGETTQIIGGGRVPVKTAHAVSSSLGALGKTGAALQAFAPEADATDTLRAIRYFFPGLYTYNPKKQQKNKLYEEVQRLQNLLRKRQDESGQKVPTKRELQLQGLIPK
jgi:hypothetical protein